MTSPGGDWVAVPIPGEPDRWDWVPIEQPASPDGGPGRWHVVGGSGPQAGTWEWFPGTSVPPPPPPFAVSPAAGTLPTTPAAMIPAAGAWPAAAQQPGWYAAPPIALPRTRRSRKLPLAILGGLVAIAVVAVVAVVALSGNDDGKNKKEITALATYVVTVDNGKDVCASHLTSDFVQNMFGSMETCEKADSSSTDPSGHATGATVTNIKLRGNTATATVTDVGGDSDGATGTWSFAKGDDKVWRVSEWRADYLRANFQKAFGDHYKSTGADDPFTDAALRGCVTGRALDLDDAAFLNFAHQQFRSSDEATKLMLGFMGDCPSGTDGVSALRALFEKGFRQSVSTSLAPDTTDCIVLGLRSALSDDDIKELSIHSDQPHPDIAARVQQTSIGCSGSGTQVPTSPTIASPAQGDPGFHL